MNTEPEALLERVRRVPERQKAVSHRHAYQNLKQQVDEMQQILARAEAVERSLTDVFGLAPSFQERTTASKAITRLANAFAGLADDGDPASLAEMQRAARHALSGLQSVTEKAWRAEVNEFVSRFAGLLDLLARMRLPLAVEAKAAVSVLQQLSGPPLSEPDRRKASAAVQEVKTVLARVGGTGGAESEGLRFLREVGEGKATAQRLLDSQIQDFLTEHNLWDMLKVSAS